MSTWGRPSPAAAASSASVWPPGPPKIAPTPPSFRAPAIVEATVFMARPPPAPDDACHPTEEAPPSSPAATRVLNRVVGRPRQLLQLPGAAASPPGRNPIRSAPRRYGQ